MQLRDDPRMSYHRVSNWPPVWTKGIKKRDTKTVVGEVGILRYVHYYRLPAHKCYLVIEYQHEYFVGALIFDDPSFCAQIAEILQQQIGHSIKEIGDLDISHTF
jgi:hypothetical protein